MPQNYYKILDVPQNAIQSYTQDNSQILQQQTELMRQQQMQEQIDRQEQMQRYQNSMQNMGMHPLYR